MMAAPLHAELRRHVERGGHTDRFDAYLGDRLICTSRSGWHEPARKLLDMGYPAATLLIVRHAGRAFDPTIKPRPIGELAKWCYEERDKGGIKRRRWKPFGMPRNGVGVASKTGWDAPPGIRGHRAPGALAGTTTTGTARRSQAASPAGADAAGGMTGRPTLLLGAQRC